jgi:hypothetical protein
LTSVAKGQVTQPWQGEGALLDNGRGKLVPFILTGGRRSRYRTAVVDGLDLVLLPGFDRIAVAAEQAEGSESADAAAVPGTVNADGSAGESPASSFS